jgi:hypothetical protein
MKISQEKEFKDLKTLVSEKEGDLENMKEELKSLKSTAKS